MANHRQLRISGFILLIAVLGFGISKSRALRAGFTGSPENVYVPAYAINSVQQVSELPLKNNEKKEAIELMMESTKGDVVLSNGIEVLIID